MTDDQVDELMQAARDIRFLLRITVDSELERMRTAAFGGDERKEEAFRLLAEGESYRSIAEAVGIRSSSTISGWVGDWRDLGLVHPDDQTVLASPSLLGLAWGA